MGFKNTKKHKFSTHNNPKKILDYYLTIKLAQINYKLITFHVNFVIFASN
jgi:hypothetical protein